jgi:ABC-2 type transport system permease protein
MDAPESTSSLGAAQPARYGELYDRGYQHYDGPRLGRRHAFWALARYSMKRALGIKKGWTSKVVPILLYVAVALTVVIPLGVEAFVPGANVLAYWDFLAVIFGILVVFVATIAPEMLCGDRRENVLSLYFSRAISRLDYLLAKVVAATVLTLSITVVPAVVYWLGRQLLDNAPLAAMRDHLGDLGRLILAGVLLSAYLGSLALTIASFSGRKGIAAAVTVVGFGVATALAFALSQAVNSADRRYFVVVSPLDVNHWFDYRLFGQPTFGTTTNFGGFLAVWQYAGALIVTCALACAVMYRRYVPNE